MKRLLLTICTAGALACGNDTRLPIYEVRQDLRVGSIPAGPLDLEAGLGGNMYLLVTDQKEVRVYDPIGALTNTFTGRPEPFQRPVALGHVAGLLAIYDSAAYKVFLIRSNGELVQTVPLQQRTPGGPTRRAFHQLLRDGSFLIREYENPAQTRVVRIHRGGTDTIATIGERGRAVFSPQDGMVVTVDAAPEAEDSVGFRVSKLNLVGDTVWSQVWRHRRNDNLRPGADAAFVLANGSVLVRQAGEGKAVPWTAFGMVGKPLYQFEAPGQIQFLAAGTDFLYGVRDAEGERELLRFRVRPRS